MKNEKINKKNQKNCNCGAYHFPHQPCRQCEEYAAEQERMEKEDKEYRAELQAYWRATRGV